MKTATTIKPIKQIYIEVPHVKIGQTILTYGRRDWTKTVKRKVYEKSIHLTANELKINLGVKVGNTICYEMLDKLQEMNGFLMTGEKANIYLYKFTTPKEIFPYGNVFYQLIAEYGELKYRYRYFIKNTLANGKKDIWYLNDWNSHEIPLIFGKKINKEELENELTL